ncbi:MAG: FHA domain-containing protein [Deltaproteobacteria bacterium]|nr:FHA domain-containing protein [Deltaproteobacteria bacterium]
MTTGKYRYELSIDNGKGGVRNVPLAEGRHTVGRSSECDICIADSSLSRHHATIEVTQDEVVVEDWRSLNGTSFQGSRISQPTRWPAGREVVFGEVRTMLVEVDEGPGADGEVWFELLNTDARGRRISVRGPRTVIGRSHTADCQINHPSISRAHAIISYDTDERSWVVEDRNSANGTFVDGTMVSRALLSGGEKVRLGDVELKYLGPHAPAPRRRMGLVILLIALLGASIGLLLVSLFWQMAG